MKRESGTWPAIGSRSRKLRRDVESLLAQITDLAGDTDVIRAATVLSAELTDWSALVHRAQDLVAPLTDRMQRAALPAAESFTDQLKDALSLAGFSVYGDGSVLIADGIVFVQTDTEFASLRINGQEYGTFNVQQIVRLVQDRSTQLKTDASSPADFLRELRIAYDLACLVEARDFGTQLQTLALLPHLAFLRQRTGFRSNPVKEQFRPYPFEQFRADLYALLQSGQVGTYTEAFRYASGSETKGAVFMLVPTLGRTAHVGRVWFERTQAL